MKKKYVIWDMCNYFYWYGFYTNKRWTNTIFEAKLFDSEEAAEDLLRIQYDDTEFTNKVFQIIPVYRNTIL